MLWLLEQDEVNDYDSYDSCVVVAPDADAARRVSPSHYHEWSDLEGSWMFAYHDGRREKRRRDDWASHVDNVKATLLGVADDPTPRVVCASFNAG